MAGAGLRLVARYLGTVKAALLNEHYLEDEARLAHLTARIVAGRAPDARILRDPVRQDPDHWPRLARERQGPAGPDDGRGRSFVPYTDMGRARLDDLHGRLEVVKAEAVPGDLVDVGVGRGGAGIFLRAWLDAYDLKDRRVWLADEFRGPPRASSRPAGPSGAWPSSAPTSTWSGTASLGSVCSTGGSSSCPVSRPPP